VRREAVAVHADPVAAATRAAGHHDVDAAAAVPLEVPEHRRRAVAERRPTAAGEDRRHAAAADAEHGVADGVDAGVHGMQRPGGDPPGDRREPVMARTMALSACRRNRAFAPNLRGDCGRTR